MWSLCKSLTLCGSVFYVALAHACGDSCGSAPPHSIAKERLEGAETTMRGTTAIMDPSCHPDAGEGEM